VKQRRRNLSARPMATPQPRSTRCEEGCGRAAVVWPATIPAGPKRPATIENAILTQERSFFQTNAQPRPMDPVRPHGQAALTAHGIPIEAVGIVQVVSRFSTVSGRTGARHSDKPSSDKPSSDKPSSDKSRLSPKAEG